MGAHKPTFPFTISEVISSNDFFYVVWYFIIHHRHFVKFKCTFQLSTSVLLCNILIKYVVSHKIINPFIKKHYANMSHLDLFTEIFPVSKFESFVLKEYFPIFSKVFQPQSTSESNLPYPTLKCSIYAQFNWKCSPKKHLKLSFMICREALDMNS